MISAFPQTIFFISFSNSSREPSESLSSSQTHPLYLEAHFFVLSFHLTEMRIFIENALLFSQNYLKCLLCIYVCIYHVYYVYILILIMFAMYISLSSSSYIFLSSNIKNLPCIYRLSPRPFILFLLLNQTNYCSFHVVQWTSFSHAAFHLNLGHFH